ncbi:hypothetical protein FQA47_021414 [Oryzias melastigma]|uniref:Uncharacterized protein n=1 Tax=Oryzias melastigma TaxID=30732 RepID=A0A834FFT2_ORYME|nr:hypothetical protein FQA47_021414 [Oryzias melastigma]
MDTYGGESLRRATNEAGHHDCIIFISGAWQSSTSTGGGRRLPRSELELQPALQQIVPPVRWKLNRRSAEGMGGRAARRTAEQSRAEVCGRGKLGRGAFSSCCLSRTPSLRAHPLFMARRHAQAPEINTCPHRILALRLPSRKNFGPTDIPSVHANPADLRPVPFSQHSKR